MAATKKALDLSKVYGLLEPGPVVLLTTAHKGRQDVMTMSWHTMMEFEPPLIGCVISNRNYSFDLLKSGKSCVINIPSAKNAQKVVTCGNTTGANIDKFEQIGFTRLPAELVQAPLIAECFANLECRVVDTRFVSSYCFFVLEVVKAWVDSRAGKPVTLHHMGYGQFMLAGERIKLKSSMR